MNSKARWQLAMGAVIAASLIIVSTSARIFEPLEMWWFDQVLRLRLFLGLTPPVHKDIVILELGIDDEKADSKENYDDAAEIIREATICGAKVIAFDIVFYRGRAEASRDLRETISKVRDENQRIVVLGETLGGGKWRRSFPFLAEKERHQPAGFIDVIDEPVVRNYPMLHRRGTAGEPSFALAGYLAWIQPEKIAFQNIGEIRWFESEGGAQSASETPLLLNFRASWNYEGNQNFRHYGRSELHDKKPNLQGCILLVAQTEEGGDLHTTSLEGRQPGILIHATALNDLMQNSSLRRLPWYADAFMLLLSMAVPFLALRWIRSPHSVAMVWLAGLALLLAASFIVIVKLLWVPGTILASLGWSAMCAILGTQRAAPAARRLARMEATHSQFDVFISAAHPDYDFAAKVHGFLEGSNISAFFCERSLLQIGNARFSKAIDDALEQATHMIVVATRPEHLRRTWVESEWRFFYEELRAGRKQGNLVLVSNDAIPPGEMPGPLRGYEVILASEGLEPLVAYLRPAQPKIAVR